MSLDETLVEEVLSHVPKKNREQVLALMKMVPDDVKATALRRIRMESQIANQRVHDLKTKQRLLFLRKPSH